MHFINIIVIYFDRIHGVPINNLFKNLTRGKNHLKTEFTG